MSMILCIDTTLEEAAIGLAKDGKLLSERTNNAQMDHAAWLHTAIRNMLVEMQQSLNNVEAVAVASGPGSYTGLRVGMATAKGLCFALGVPLITENILKLTALQARRERPADNSLPVLYCPMIDARRMEVFTALYDASLQEVVQPYALVLDEQSFEKHLETNTVVFNGNGAPKWKNICRHPHALFVDARHQLSDLARVAETKYLESRFSDLAYSEPDYFKNFHTGK